MQAAIGWVSAPQEGLTFTNMGNLQVFRRLLSLLRERGYQYEDSHAAAWGNLMDDVKADPYGRLCAAYFLLDSRPSARQFIRQQVSSADLRIRYNAAEVVNLYVGRDSTKTWGVDLLLELLASGAIDPQDCDSPSEQEAPEAATQEGASGADSSLGLFGRFNNEAYRADREDISCTPLDQICWEMGFMKEKKAVGALIQVLERQPRAQGAAFALGEIGDMRAVPILMKRLQDGPDDEDRAVTALGKLRYKPAVPILLRELGNP
ncbi:MAG: HEAT repeat domain-containing protein, partial [Planctomycetota bacterium]|nr:HEAT repeat domain-containing protein [Planctomycetota bacterium]